MDQQQKDLMIEIVTVDCGTKRTFFKDGLTCAVGGFYMVIDPNGKQHGW